MKYKPANAQPKISDLKLIRRLLSRIELNDNGCWVWAGCKHHVNGYGQIKHNKKAHQVHRISYAVFNGSIEYGLTVEHTCKNRLCCNPDHLILLPHEINCKRL